MRSKSTRIAYVHSLCIGNGLANKGTNSYSHGSCRSMVSFHGYPNLHSHSRKITVRSPLIEEAATMETTPAASSVNTSTSDINLHPPLLSNASRFSPNQSMFEVNERPPDPLTFLETPEKLKIEVDKLVRWFQCKKSILCLTGAGISTESGIPDYRGYNGSYHIGHKPMIHDHFMKSVQARKRYWGRGMVGWRFVDMKQPSMGHHAITKLELHNKLGVTFDDKVEFYTDELEYLSTSGQQKLSLITQNVDSLHRRAGTKHLLELHGRNDILHCTNCNHQITRTGFHDELEVLNSTWLQAALEITKSSDMRADGDASVTMNYDDVIIPHCSNCGKNGFYKPNVVFFGDIVPAHRVKLFQAAVDHCDGLFVVGSSLAVHSAFRHVKSAHKQGIPIAILNVGETRAEIEKLNVLKIEAPAGPTLERLAIILADESPQRE